MGTDHDLGRLCGFVCGGRDRVMSHDRPNEAAFDVCWGYVLNHD